MLRSTLDEEIEDTLYEEEMLSIVTANEDSCCTPMKLRRQGFRMEEEGNSTTEIIKPKPDVRCRIYATVVTVTAILALAGTIHHHSAEITAIFQPFTGDCDCNSPAVGQDDEGNNFTIGNSRVIPECCTTYCSWFRCVDLVKCGHFPECPEKGKDEQAKNANDEKDSGAGTPAQREKDDHDHPHGIEGGNRKSQEPHARDKAQKKLKQKKEEGERKATKGTRRLASEVLKEAFKGYYQGFVPLVW